MPGKRKDWLDRMAPIETSILRGRHPNILGLKVADRGVYFGIIGICRDLCREVLPSIYCDHKYRRLADDLGVDVRMLRPIIERLLQRRLIYSIEVPQKCGTSASIGVTKLRLKWPWLTFKDEHLLLDSSDSSEKDSSEEDAHARDSNFDSVLGILKEIDVPAYRSIEADEKWERDLADVMADPAIGLDLPGLIAEAQKFRTWFESQIEIGKLKRAANHRPRHRFVNGWLRQMREFKRNQGGPGGESASDKILREAREEIARCETA